MRACLLNVNEFLVFLAVHLAQVDCNSTTGLLQEFYKSRTHTDTRLSC